VISNYIDIKFQSSGHRVSTVKPIRCGKQYFCLTLWVWFWESLIQVRNYPFSENNTHVQQ